MKVVMKLRLSSIPICCLNPLQLVGPVLKVDVQSLENEFVNEYREGNMVLYVFIEDDKGRVEPTIENTCGSWDEHWQT